MLLTAPSLLACGETERDFGPTEGSAGADASGGGMTAGAASGGAGSGGAADGGAADGGAADGGAADGGDTGTGGQTCSSTDTLEHCGACFDACDDSYAEMRCVAGDCIIDSCAPGYCNVDGAPRNGCEAAVNLYADPENCGTCGNVCSSGVCTGGACQSRVFITSTVYTGNLGGLSGADQKCQDRADAAGLGGTWRAWLSTNVVSVAARLAHSAGPIARTDGEIVADDWTDLTDGMLNFTLTVNELGEEIDASNYSVLTNTNSDGSSVGPDDCSDWTTSSFDILVVHGSADYSDARWSVLSTSGVECGLEARLYCFEQ